MRLSDKEVVFDLKKEKVVFGKVFVFTRNFYSDVYVIHNESGFAIFHFFTSFKVDRDCFLDNIKRA